jgi:imidazolonepropionase-like amidohydrolase
MRRLLFSLITVLFSVCGGFGQVVAIRAGLVVDPESGKAAQNQVILVEKGKITAIGKDVTIPAGAQIVDLSGQTVLPGLMDAHTHLCGNMDPKWDLDDFLFMALQRRPGYRALTGAKNAREMLKAGFTTVRDVGNAGDYIDMDLEKAIRFGVTPGPTMLPAGRIIAPFGGQFHTTPTDGKLLDNPEYYFADSHDELRKAVRENIYWGARVIKIVVDAKPYQYSAEDIRFVIEEAGRAGLKVAAHVQTERGARAAIEAGVASIEHGWNLTDDDLALAKKNGVVLVSTDFTEAALIAGGMSPEQAHRSHQKFVDRLRRAYKAGVTVVFGTDLMVSIPGQTRGEAALDYIDSFVEAGVPAPAIVRAMTSDAARLLGVEDERGALKPGMAADIVAVTGNPLEDPQVLKHIAFVMKNGKVFRGIE